MPPLPLKTFINPKSERLGFDRMIKTTSNLKMVIRFYLNSPVGVALIVEAA